MSHKTTVRISRDIRFHTETGYFYLCMAQTGQVWSVGGDNVIVTEIIRAARAAGVDIVADNRDSLYGKYDNRGFQFPGHQKTRVLTAINDVFRYEVPYCTSFTYCEDRSTRSWTDAKSYFAEVMR